MTDDFADARDAVLVAKVLLTGAFCVSCVAAQTPFEEARVRLLVEGMEPYVRVKRNTGSCDGCSAVTVTYGLM